MQCGLELKELVQMTLKEKVPHVVFLFKNHHSKDGQKGILVGRVPLIIREFQISAYFLP